MKKFMLGVMVILISIGGTAAQNIYATDNGHVSFYSEAPISDVDARNGKVKVELNTSTGEVTFDIVMSDFQFKNKKMGRDAQKKYIEIEKYPKAGFKGKITGRIDYDKAGTYPAAATGKLEIHGVEKEMTEKGTITVGKKKIKIRSEFRIALKDHNIETPKILGQEMTKEDVLVTVEATLSAQEPKAVSKKTNN